jgi:23S rRNA (cytidine1920-2'-O)/16S rRNA (cytidine1409-2'-O)-methyltransferase
MSPARARPSGKTRLDRLLVDRGLAESRERAQALILEGLVEVDGRRAGKAGEAIAVGAELRVLGPDHPYVGRGGVKLAGALDRWRLDPAGRVVLDVGASTGGFTDCLLQRGARRVYALDVGTGQLHYRLRKDPRVVVLERINARHLRPGAVPERVTLVTVDVSFISLRLVLPPLLAVLAEEADLVALVKPQFEVGRREVGRGGIVRDRGLHRRVLEEIVDLGRGLGLSVRGVCASPLPGAEGNQEYFIHFRNEGPPLPGEHIRRALEEATRV